MKFQVVLVSLLSLVTFNEGSFSGRCPVINFVQQPDCTTIRVASQCSKTRPCPIEKTCCPGICGAGICLKTTDLPPKPTCPLLPCPPPPIDICPHGYDLDKNGCQTCTCRRSVHPQCKPVPIYHPSECAAILVVNECSVEQQNCPPGKTCCPGICGARQCVTINHVCRPLQCPPPPLGGCPFGFETDKYGCPTCSCKGCPLVKCSRQCPHGFAKDLHGCNTCHCKVIPPRNCPAVPFYRPSDCAARLVIRECSVNLQNCPPGKTCCPGICGARTCLRINSCPRVPCSRYCPNGFVKGLNGCNTCKCKVIPPRNCPPVPFYRPSDCAARLVIRECSVNLQNCPPGKTCCPGICGARTCLRINRIRSTTTGPCPCGSKCCRLYCPHGYVRDRNGCELCKCYICPLVKCSRQCPHGFAKDLHGCNTCQCKVCPLVKCSRQCPHGFAKDLHGCNTCQCKVIPPRNCPAVPFYQPSDCAAILVTRECSVNLQNCPPGKTCCPGICGATTCLRIKSCPCGSKCCRLYCPHGYVRDRNGCELCKCKTIKPVCTDRHCRKSCRYGYRRLRNGCPSCQCRRGPTYRFSDDDK